MHRDEVAALARQRHGRLQEIVSSGHDGRPNAPGAAVARARHPYRDVYICGAEHLIDPRSGRPAPPAASASVTGPDLGLAGTPGTALAVAGEQGLARIDGLVGYEALVINPDGSERRTQGFAGAARGTVEERS